MRLTTGLEERRENAFDSLWLVIILQSWSLDMWSSFFKLKQMFWGWRVTASCWSNLQCFLTMDCKWGLSFVKKTYQSFFSLAKEWSWNFTWVTWFAVYLNWLTFLQIKLKNSFLTFLKNSVDRAKFEAVGFNLFVFIENKIIIKQKFYKTRQKLCVCVSFK